MFLTTRRRRMRTIGARTPIGSRRYQAMNELETVRGMTGIDNARGEGEVFDQGSGARNGNRLGATRGGNRWIIVDRTWAKRLGLRRDAGVYRIRSKDLALRLALLPRDARGEAVARTERGVGRAVHGPFDRDHEPLELRGRARAPHTGSEPAAA
jgi:hypothetical protein